MLTVVFPPLYNYQHAAAAPIDVSVYHDLRRTHISSYVPPSGGFVFGKEMTL